MSYRARAEELRLMWTLERGRVAWRNMSRGIEMLREPDGPVAFYFQERFKSRDA